MVIEIKSFVQTQEEKLFFLSKLILLRYSSFLDEVEESLLEECSCVLC